EAVDAAKLRKHQGNQMIPALEGFVVGVRVIPIHSGLEPATIDRFKQTAKDAIDVAHARPFLSLDNQKEPIASVRPGMHRDTVNHPRTALHASGGPGAAHNDSRKHVRPTPPARSPRVSPSTRCRPGSPRR